jgi:hypothetical protein
MRGIKEGRHCGALLQDVIAGRYCWPLWRGIIAMQVVIAGRGCGALSDRGAL